MMARKSGEWIALSIGTSYTKVFGEPAVEPASSHWAELGWKYLKYSWRWLVLGAIRCLALVSCFRSTHQLTEGLQASWKPQERWCRHDVIQLKTQKLELFLGKFHGVNFFVVKTSAFFVTRWRLTFVWPMLKPHWLDVLVSHHIPGQ